MGTLLAAIALAIDIKDRTNSGLWVGGVLVAAWLPTLVVGLTLGPLIDRLERRKLMVAADLIRAGVFCALPFTARPATIVVLAVVAGLASGFFRPAVFAGVPNLVPADELAAWRTSAGQSARSSADCSRVRRARMSRTGSTPCRSSPRRR